jgi:hypothetical protein
MNALEPKGFASEAHLIDHLRSIYSDDYYDYAYSVAGIVFDPSHSYDSKLPDDVTYSIRMGGEWQTDDIYADKSFDAGPNWNSLGKFHVVRWLIIWQFDIKRII